jgi:hypothetical protein
MPEWNAPLDDMEVERLELVRNIRRAIARAHEVVAVWEPAPWNPLEREAWNDR